MRFLDLRPPTSLRLAMASAGESWDQYSSTAPSPFVIFKKQQPHNSHPALGHLILLIFGAVLEVVCVSLPGYIIARLGHFDADKQKFLANLNVMLFTPCLIFTKLASQLNADKLVELGVIPIIFVIQTLVSYLVATVVSKCFGFNKRASNFVTAMGVFGNSNSLPISLVISLSQTLKGLHWDKIKGDNDDEVAARGILYLMIFQQLGQLVRWSWGYHILLAPKDKYEEYNNDSAEEGRFRGEAHDDGEADRLLEGENRAHSGVGEEFGTHRSGSPAQVEDSEGYEPAGQTPVGGSSRASPNDSEDDEHDTLRKRNAKSHTTIVIDGNVDGSIYQGDELNQILSFPRIRNTDEPEIPSGIIGAPKRVGRFLTKFKVNTSRRLSSASQRAFNTLPRPLQSLLVGLHVVWARVCSFLWEFMNPPLWAMLVAVLVASVPELQKLFFEDESFIKTSVTSAISSSAGVAVPLILVVLGANLARNTQNQEGTDAEEKEIGARLLVASLICRMLLPTLIMAPILAVFAKYVPVSILDDPIFVIVCFLLTGAPSALQLAQICQINNVYEVVMGKILFQSYVIWILPSTLILVVCALEVVEWAK
ncbi:auxin efflux carrier [Lasiosphaeria miniovina]|uniref:Auxin efflux carrier n=1 Tax=Lasiosphaeria miniovina TaxID=1954250 RepID=A0AA40BGC6_9PEZI|nr:auxin efflux carrier [Lasiosphaeria miniovina]KAK0733741.1 auxin efflux carrier [Lasiosphaeria miniovina]